MISRVIRTFKCTVLATLAKPLQDNCLKLWTMFNGMDSRIQKSSTVFCSSGMQLHLTLSFSCLKIYALKIRSMDLKSSSMLNVLMMQQFVDHMPRLIWVEISLFNDIQGTRPLYVIEVLGKYSYNKLQTLQASTTDKYHFFSDLLKDDQNSMYASKRKYSIDYGTEKASVSVYSWCPKGKNMTFAADLLTGKKLVDHPYVGFISQIYFTDSFSCQAFEYKMRYDE